MMTFYNEQENSIKVESFDLNERGCGTEKFRVPSDAKAMSTFTQYRAPHIRYKRKDSDKNGIKATFYDEANRFISVESACLLGRNFQLDEFHVPANAEMMTISVKISSPVDYIDDSDDEESESSGFSDNFDSSDGE